MNVLDVGCGWKPQGDVNVDLYPYWVEQRSRLAEGVPSAELKVQSISNFVKASSMDLPFRDEAFDLVISTACIEHVPDPYKMLLELMRVSSNQVIVKCPHHFGDTKKNKMHLHHFNRRSFERVLNKLGVSYELSITAWKVFPHSWLPLVRLPLEITVKIWKA